MYHPCIMSLECMFTVGVDKCTCFHLTCSVTTEPRTSHAWLWIHNSLLSKMCKTWVLITHRHAAKTWLLHSCKYDLVTSTIVSLMVCWQNGSVFDPVLHHVNQSANVLESCDHVRLLVSWFSHYIIILAPMFWNASGANFSRNTKLSAQAQHFPRIFIY